MQSTKSANAPFKDSFNLKVIHPEINSGHSISKHDYCFKAYESHTHAKTSINKP